MIHYASDPTDIAISSCEKILYQKYDYQLVGCFFFHIFFRIKKCPRAFAERDQIFCTNTTRTDHTKEDITPNLVTLHQEKISGNRGTYPTLLKKEKERKK